MEKKSVPGQLALKDIVINDTFYSKYVRHLPQILDYQWKVMNDLVPDAEKSHCIANFRIAAGLEKGDFYGFVFQDSDLAKWLEAASYYLETNRDAELEKKCDYVIDLIARAQQEDGYFNTYFIIKDPEKKWTNVLECHELYTGGHFIEAAVAYFEATGKRRFLDCMQVFADLVCKKFGAADAQLHGYPGHQEIELALIKLYRVTGCERYLAQAEYFIGERGKQPSFFSAEYEKRGRTMHFPNSVMLDPTYAQYHMPPVLQKEAVGHSVRAVYLYCAMADLARERSDENLRAACKTLFDNIVLKKMHITGGIGASAHGERFAGNYDLPNTSTYNETCASIGLALFALRMLRLERDSRYADVMEQCLYNTVLSGISLTGTEFFYVNPLEVVPENCEENTSLAHVKNVRQRWFGCACCPPNIARTFGSLGQYLYTLEDSVLYVNLYVSNTARFNLNGKGARITILSKYPYCGNIRIEADCPACLTLALRIPARASLRTLTLDGKTAAYRMEKGFATVRLESGICRIELNLDIPARFEFAHPAVSADAGKTALVKGPLVYCLEEADNGAGLSGITVRDDAPITERFDPALLGGTLILEVPGEKETDSGWTGTLYGTAAPQKTPITVKAVPYCLWNNRGKGEMLVWIRRGNG